MSVSSRVEWSWLDPRHAELDALDFAFALGQRGPRGLALASVHSLPRFAEMAIVEMDRRESLGEDVDRRHPFAGRPVFAGFDRDVALEALR